MKTFDFLIFKSGKIIQNAKTTFNFYKNVRKEITYEKIPFFAFLGVSLHFFKSFFLHFRNLVDKSSHISLLYKSTFYNVL